MMFPLDPIRKTASWLPVNRFFLIAISVEFTSCTSCQEVFDRPPGDHHPARLETLMPTPLPGPAIVWPFRSILIPCRSETLHRPGPCSAPRGNNDRGEDSERLCGRREGEHGASHPFEEIGSVAMTPDGRRFVVTVYSSRSDVWVADNFDATPEPNRERVVRGAPDRRWTARSRGSWMASGPS